MCEFISQSYTYVSWSSPLKLSLRNLRSASLDCIDPTLIKEISSVQKVKEALSETSVWSVSSSHRLITLTSGSSLLTLFSWNLESDIWDPIGAHDEKGNVLKYKLETSRLRDCFLMCDFITQISTLPFLEHFANTVVVDFAKVYLGAHWGLWWKSKYPPIITGEKLSEKLHCHVWMQLT